MPLLVFALFKIDKIDTCIYFIHFVLAAAQSYYWRDKTSVFIYMQRNRI